VRRIGIGINGAVVDARRWTAAPAPEVLVEQVAAALIGQGSAKRESS
jgi:hypothetical protein